LPAPVVAPIIPGGNEKPAAMLGRGRGRWDHVMSSEQIYPVPESLARSAWCDEESYFEMYRHSIEDADEFWAEQAKRLDWIKPWRTVKNTSFAGDVHIKWFEGGKLNVCVNCVDRRRATTRRTTSASPIASSMKKSAGSPTS
jgi:hypothetical protein